MNTIDKALIVSLTPYFLEKGVVWFDEHLQEILDAQKSQAFFQDNTFWLQKGQTYQITALLRKLDEMGYEKVFTVESPGEFSHTGGIIEVFPINRREALRLDFLGNTLEAIEILPVHIENEEKSRQLLQKKLKSQTTFSDIKNLVPGDYVVHLDHGVAQFKGKESIDNQEYYVLEYAQSDRLFVPVGLERKLSRYVGFASPAVSRLSSSLWQHQKRKIKEEVEKLAKELLALYSQKEIARRAPYLEDKDLEKELRASFEYQETPDQLAAMEDITKDLQKDVPMDRIVCGDVGFGKTEIAMRTALLALANNRQTAVICPTTILAKQHYDNFQRRFKNIPCTVALLSRLQPLAEQHKILQQIKDGKIDIIIGTHRILSTDIDFKNLQMLIIDDEQRFGVKQKEKLRAKNPALDMLSLSATPIPRTIYLALSSLKNISLIQTPPRGRETIHTHVLPYSKTKIQEAISHELARGGQVYFLHNRVQTIEKTKRSLEELLPHTRIGYIHGRMHEKKIVTLMDEFTKKRLQILVATTIIENGIDLPNVNTIIVDDASRLGLAQAYQIRGRVGRSHAKGFAYLLYPKKLTPIARERLKALQEAKELGSGYRIALKDLELRGAGNILGREQSGSINKVGLNLYCQILADAVEKLRSARLAP